MIIYCSFVAPLSTSKHYKSLNLGNYSFMAFFNGVTNHAKGGNNVLQDLSKLVNPEQRKEAQKDRQNHIIDLKNRTVWP